jgi:hypothetical protein
MNALSIRANMALLLLPAMLLETRSGLQNAARKNDIAWVLIVIPIAVVIALGLMTAWFIYCQNRGMWPALDMPSWSSGGTWKLYCKS